MTATHKDQLRSLKNAVQSKLNSTFKPRPQMQFSEANDIASSGPQSECSTLIDYSTDYSSDDLEDGEPEAKKMDASLLEAENCARMHRSQVPSNTQVAFAGNEMCYAAQMLDVEDRAWDSSRQKASLPTRILQAFVGQ